MEKHTVTALATFHRGAKLGLSSEQAKARLHNLKALGDGVYEVQDSVQFKVGEVIGLDVIPKASTASFAEPKKPARKMASRGLAR